MCTAITCTHNVKSYCSLPEVELTFAAAIDFGGTSGTRVWLRCTDLQLPSQVEKTEDEIEMEAYPDG